MRGSNTAQKLPVADIDHTPAIKAIRDFANSPAMKVLRDYANSPEANPQAAPTPAKPAK